MSKHPLQSPKWGEFRKKTGLKVIQIVGYQLTVHRLPKLPWTILYFPKGPVPTVEMLKQLKQIAIDEKAILVKLEPNVEKDEKIINLLLENGCVRGNPLFTKFTFQLDLTLTEDELLAKMKPKTRYNIKIARRYKVEVYEDNSKSAFEKYLQLTKETTQRQGFYTHTPTYHRLLWETLKDSGIYHLFLAEYRKQVVAAYVFFTYDQVLYYPYGASGREHREVMAPSLLFWEAIKFGKRNNCLLFDLWGSLGLSPDLKDPWFGFHRFKEGFGGRLVEFIGTYDLVLNRPLYWFYRLGDFLRWRALRLKSRFC